MFCTVKKMNTLIYYKNTKIYSLYTIFHTRILTPCCYFFLYKILLQKIVLHCRCFMFKEAHILSYASHLCYILTLLYYYRDFWTFVRELLSDEWVVKNYTSSYGEPEIHVVSMGSFLMPPPSTLQPPAPQFQRSFAWCAP